MLDSYRTVPLSLEYEKTPEELEQEQQEREVRVQRHRERVQADLACLNEDSDDPRQRYRQRLWSEEELTELQALSKPHLAQSMSLYKIGALLAPHFGRTESAVMCALQKLLKKARQTARKEKVLKSTNCEKALRVALLAWLRADNPDLTAPERESLLQEARYLTGQASAGGYLHGK